MIQAFDALEWTLFLTKMVQTFSNRRMDFFLQRKNLKSPRMAVESCDSNKHLPEKDGGAVLKHKKERVDALVFMRTM